VSVIWEFGYGGKKKAAKLSLGGFCTTPESLPLSVFLWKSV